jgi:hypothetical protein
MIGQPSTVIQRSQPVIGSQFRKQVYDWSAILCKSNEQHRLPYSLLRRPLGCPHNLGGKKEKTLFER